MTTVTKNFDLKKGGQAQFILSANPTTGYNWHYDVPQGLKVTTKFNTSAAHGVCGAGGTYTFTVEAEKDGQYELKMTYARPGELNKRHGMGYLTDEEINRPKRPGLGYRI